MRKPCTHDPVIGKGNFMLTIFTYTVLQYRQFFRGLKTNLYHIRRFLFLDLLVPETVRTILENRDCFNMKKWGWLLAEELNVSVEPDCIYQCQNDDFKLLEKILYAWCAKLGHHATLSRLRNIFEMMGKMYVAEALSELGDRSAWGKNFSTKEFPSSSKTLPDEILHRRFTYEPNGTLINYSQSNWSITKTVLGLASAITAPPSSLLHLKS